MATATTEAEWASIPPSFLTVDLTWNCNYDCVGCIDTLARDGSKVVRTRQGGDPANHSPELCVGPTLCDEAVAGVIDFAKRERVHGVQLMGGETLLHPRVDEILWELAEAGIPVELVTNGSLLSEHSRALQRTLSIEGSFVRVSINGWGSYGSRIGWPGRGDELRSRVIDGLGELRSRLGADAASRLFVSTVAFEDALEDFEDIVMNLAGLQINRVVVIRERDPKMKEFIPGQEGVGGRVISLASQLRARLAGSPPEIRVAGSVTGQPIPQEKPYLPCPAAVLKTNVGADGRLYACTDHRGSEQACIADLREFDWDFGACWRSSSRVHRLFGHVPGVSCSDIVCRRFGGNIVVHMLRNRSDTWTF
jgi:sulfatase maturation enzyme AslB (radical SAM superfamily)